MSSTLTLEERIKRLEDIEEIKKLQATYLDCVNWGWDGRMVNAEKLSEVFSEDVSWGGNTMENALHGLNNVIGMLKGAPAAFDMAMHSFTNPIVEVDGDTATGKMLLWVGVKKDGATNQHYQSENVRYVRTAKGWRIQVVDLRFGWLLNS